MPWQSGRGARCGPGSITQRGDPSARWPAPSGPSAVWTGSVGAIADHAGRPTLGADGGQLGISIERSVMFTRRWERRNWEKYGRVQLRCTTP
jgi:hypothetical protein